MKDANTAKINTRDWSLEEYTHSIPKNRPSPYDLSFSLEESLRRELLPLLTSSAFLEELLVILRDCI